MKVIFLGDIVGESGYKAVEKHLPGLRDRFQPDLIIVNAENINKEGVGISDKNYYRLMELGIDAITLGNHAFMDPSIEKILDSHFNIIRPANYKNQPGHGIASIPTNNNQYFIVINLAMNLYMPSIEFENPFIIIERLLEKYSLSHPTIAGIFIDLHGTSAFEKNAFAYCCDGRVTAIIGTHTHVPTSDTQILAKGTCYRTDTGMCGNTNSCGGINQKEAIDYFKHGYQSFNRVLAVGEGSVSGVFFKCDNKTKLASMILPIHIGTNFIWNT